MPRLLEFGARRWPAVLLVALAIAWQAPQAAASGEEAEAFIRELADKSIAMLDPSFGTPGDRETAFRAIIGDGFAMEMIGRFVVGRHWRTMTGEQKTEYQALFKEWMVKSYAGRLRPRTGQQVRFLRTIEVNERDTFVRTWVSRIEGRPPIVADWRVRKVGGQYRIIDIIIEGISMAAAQKSEFESVIRKEGIEGLIRNLRERRPDYSVKTG